MGFLKSWIYLKANAEKSLGSPSPRADAIAPLHARLGARILVQETPVIRAVEAGSFFDAPDSPQDIIRAISHLRLGVGDLWRFHTTVADDPLNDDSRFVQVFVDGNGEIADAMLCSRLSSFTPTGDEVAAYAGRDGAGLGAMEYTFGREQLASMGVQVSDSMPEIGVTYTRDIQPERDFIAPLQGEESRIEDATGQHGMHAEVWFMPYVRTLTDGSPEFLLIQMSHQTDHNGDTTQEMVYVQLWIGIPLDASRIQIL